MRGRNRETKNKKLKKELKLLDVYAIATGTTLSAGFFLLPGLAAVEAGPALVIAYLIAAVPLIPAMFSIVELATAMPRAGGVYYFLDRAMGPYMGTIGGMGTWLALILKVAFALIGMGAYIGLFFPELPIIPVAIALALILGALNLFGAKKSGGLQVFLVFGLLALLGWFIGMGLPEVKFGYFRGFWDAGSSSIIATAGLVYISYVGVTNVASLSEEVKNPERNLPLGIFLALGTSIVIYVLGTIVMVGVLPIERLMGNMTPVASAAEVFFGHYGAVFLSVAALFAFISVANAGTLSASRYPLAMSRDHIVPPFFKKLGKIGTPYFSIILTVLVIISILLLFNPTKIAKLASAFQLLMFAFICLAVIVMRESKIESYDPGYKSPFYPYMQIGGIIASIVLIVEMGWLPSVFTLGLVVLSTFWYFYYAHKRVTRAGAIYHVFQRLGRMRYEGLDRELRGIMKEKGLRKGDPFDEVVTRSMIMDINEHKTFEEVVKPVSKWLSNLVPYTPKEIAAQFMEGTKIGATPVTHGMALPHLRIKGLEQPEMVIVRANNGVEICYNDPLTMSDEEVRNTVNALFFLVSPAEDSARHLRILAQIAGKVDEDSFAEEWRNAKDEQHIKESLLHDDRFISLIVGSNEKTKPLAGKAIKDIKIPEGCLIALLQREGRIIAPGGKTVLENEDRLTIIGEPVRMKKFAELYGSH